MLSGFSSAIALITNYTNLIQINYKLWSFIGGGYRISKKYANFISGGVSPNFASGGGFMAQFRYRWRCGNKASGSSCKDTLKIVIIIQIKHIYCPALVIVSNLEKSSEQWDWPPKKQWAVRMAQRKMVSSEIQYPPKRASKKSRVTLGQAMYRIKMAILTLTSSPLLDNFKLWIEKTIYSVKLKTFRSNSQHHFYRRGW